MKRKAKTWKVWCYRGLAGSGVGVNISAKKPVWEEGLGWWWRKLPVSWAESGDPLWKYLFGLSRLPPRGEAWLVEVTAPGKSRVVRKLKGGA